MKYDRKMKICRPDYRKWFPQPADNVGGGGVWVLITFGNHHSHPNIITTWKTTTN